MDRVFALLLALVLCLGMTSWAQADTEYPSSKGIVTDLAGALSDSTVSDLESLSSRLESVTGGHIYVLTMHFLGGANVQQYAQSVFDQWGLGGWDALLLMVIGEKSYALSAGDAVKDMLTVGKLNDLLATEFRTPFMDRAHDEAVSGLTVALAQAMAKATGDMLDVSGLFGRAVVSSTPQDSSLSDFLQSMFSQEDSLEDADWISDRQKENSRISWRGILIWGLVIYFLFFRRKNRGAKRYGGH